MPIAQCDKCLRIISSAVLTLDSVSLPVWWMVFSGSPPPCWSRWLGWPQRWSRCIPYTETSCTDVSGIFHRSRRNSRAGRSTGRSEKTCSESNGKGDDYCKCSVFVCYLCSFKEESDSSADRKQQSITRDYQHIGGKETLRLRLNIAIRWLP